MRGQTAQKHGRYGNESAASGYGIHKTGEKEEQAQDKNDEQGKFHDRDLIEVSGKVVVVEKASFVEKGHFC